MPSATSKQGKYNENTFEKIPTLWIQFLLFTIVMLSVYPVTADDEVALGRVQAPVTIIEYGSLTCDYCIYFHREVLPHIQSRYIDTGQVRFIYRNFPTSNAAIRGAVAARCAGDLYYKMLDVLFARVGAWAEADDVDRALIQQAAALNIDEEDFYACINDPSQDQAIIAVQLQAKTEFDIIGTPTFVVNGKVVRGKKTIEQIDALINKAL